MWLDVSGGGHLGRPLAVSVVLHCTVFLAMFLARSGASEARPPVYKVDLIAGPAGSRAVGVVRPARAPPVAPERRPPPPRAQAPDQSMRVPSPVPSARRPPERATPLPASSAATKPRKDIAATAGGGPTGGRGADVVTVRTEGIEFPYGGYLDNIVRQIALNFHPPRNAALRAEVAFLIRRDGSASNFRFVRRSGNYAFDLEAQGAVEAASNARGFGPLPDGFRDDVLPVIFSFDPRVLR